ncbi:hypothetical protein FB381_4087 [Nocardioides albertanoniae]|uniref:Uncharacterized protein n=1 Tax=Nocardioides albertanoniae TaxID=1175486 RepID=A0A543AC73_9ACTN|nr:hypothetical protein [Nocardioides albertanoniae]TQL70159.1 hypothetical protein FB381_4087 [Nocardioides albertanoniae]
MSDPISRLDQFRADTPGAPMKSAAEVRHRGDQIRRRRRAVVAAGAVAVAAAVAGPILFLSSGFGDRAIDPAPAPSETPSTAGPSPSGSASAGPVELTRANLPVAEDLVGPDDASWSETRTYDGEGDDAANPCFTETLDEAGAEATFRRDFAVGDSVGSDDKTLGTMSALVSEFGSPDSAKQVRDDLSAAAADCSTVDASTSGSLPVERDFISGGDIHVVSYLSDDPDLNARLEVATAVVSAEDRVLVLTRQRAVQDYVSPTDLQSSAVNAARRMIGAEVAADPSTDPSAPDTSAPTGVLSTANLVGAGDLAPLDRFEADWEAYTPPTDVPTLACQKDWLSSLAPREQVLADFHTTSEGVDVGQVHVAVLDFADANDAGAAYNEVMEWQEVCPADKLDVQPDVTDLPIDVGTDIKLGLDRAARSQTTYGARSEGDGMWFETELVAQYDGRLVLVGYSELAGPCPPSTGDKDDPCYQPDQPDTWPGRILAIEKAAVKAGIRDLR